MRDEDRLVSTEIAADGPVCFILRRRYRIGTSSVLRQDSIFYATDRRIDFETVIDWRERRTLLKAEFDTAIDSPQVRCEVQYGHLLRNTHRNLPQDRAKFEICAHKWICLEEEGGGIALLNRAKYGHDVSGSVMRLTLLRSPTAPDEEADQGSQLCTYSLLPFAGPFGESRVVRAGYELNDPAAVEPCPKSGGPSGEGGYSLCSVSGGSVIAESVKAPEAGGGGRELVIRLYESLGGPAVTVLRFNRKIAGAWEMDMLERNRRKLRYSGKELPLRFRAFEIRTILVRFPDV
jgi:alpha-mannosidase